MDMHYRLCVEGINEDDLSPKRKMQLVQTYFQLLMPIADELAANKVIWIDEALGFDDRTRFISYMNFKYSELVSKVQPIDGFELFVYTKWYGVGKIAMRSVHNPDVRVTIFQEDC